MSDELPPGSFNLDEAVEAVGPGQPAAAAPPAEPAAPPAPEPDDDDPAGTITGQGGVKFVPVSAVIDERNKRKEAEARVKAKDEEIAPIRQKAQAYDNAKGNLEAVKPYIDKLMTRPDLIRMLDQPPAPVQEPAGPLSAQEAVEYAKDMDLYKPDGTPDVDRAQRLAKRQEAIADKRAEARFRPLQQQTAQQQAREMRQYIGSVKDAPTAANLDKVMSSLPPELAALPEVANLALLIAKGMDSMQAGPPKPQQPPVVQTESLGGGRPGGGDSFTELDQRMADAAGVSKKDWKEAAGRYKPGGINILES